MLIKNFVIFFENFHDKFFNLWRNLIKFFERLGVSKHEISKQRTGNWFLDHVNLMMYWIQNLYIKVARKTLYRDRPICAKEVWVKSKLESKVANFFTNNHIRFQYEKSVILAKHKTILPNIFILRWILKKFSKKWENAVVAHPDFYLTKEFVYVEVWGMIHDKAYFSMMKSKQQLYEKNNIPVIDLYPKDIESYNKLHGAFFQKLETIKKNKEVQP